jgi:hypothetical protein
VDNLTEILSRGGSILVLDADSAVRPPVRSMLELEPKPCRTSLFVLTLAQRVGGDPGGHLELLVRVVFSKKERPRAESSARFGRSQLSRVESHAEHLIS